MRSPKLAIASFALLFSAAASGADPHEQAKPAGASADMPMPAPELAAFMKAFAGHWSCDTKWPANAMGPGSPEAMAKATVTVKKDLSGFWYSGVYEVKKGKTTPALKAMFFIGYDAGSKQLVMVGVDSMGGSSFETGPIEGQSAILTGEGFMMGMKVKARDSLTFKSAKEMSHQFEVDMGKGFQSMGEDTCKR